VSERLVLLGIIIAATTGVPGLLVGRHSMSGQWISVVLAVAASGFGLAGIGAFWFFGENQPIVRDWPLLPGAAFSVAIDGLSALFLLPVFFVSLLGNVYGLGYWRQPAHPENGQKLRLFYGTLTAGMALLVIARNSVVFLFGWETMALSAYFLVTTEEHDGEVREAGWLYLVATHVATLCLVGLFAVLRAASGSFSLDPLDPGRLSPGLATAIFILAVAGFGLKAGIMPLHVWLPSAHAAAPSHVSAMMSGVLIKMGIYGLARVTSLVPQPPPVWGGVVLGLGVVSGVLGVAFAIGQHDIKRLLAYHSIENIGIIVMGLGLALLGRSLGRDDWIVLGLAGGLLHVWNHALFKALLFLSAGSVIHATHTREIDHLGGLAKEMPATAFCFLVGAVAICGLPPLNGFVSEFLIYLGLFGTLESRAGVSCAAAAFAAPALALIGALAVACFVKVYGAVFLGTARTDHAHHAHESPSAITGPMGILSACCFLIGLLPPLVAPMLASAIAAWEPGLKDASLRLAALAPLSSIMITGMLLTAALFIGGAALWLVPRYSTVEKGATWGCGYAAPSPRMQYTSSSFAQLLVGLFGWVLRPRIWRPKDMSLFPQATAFHSDVPEAVLDEAVLPAVRFSGWLFSWFRVLQQGSIQTYFLYIFIALIVLLLWR
jgi:hydrogenase-4 component B